MLRCLKCGGKTVVTDSRDFKNGSRVRRRHKCVRCHVRFRTSERVFNKKKDGLKIPADILAFIKR